MIVTHLTDDTLLAKLAAKDSFVLLVGASWCTNCDNLMRQLDTKTSGNLFKADIDNVPAFARDMMIRTLPATFDFIDGKLHQTFYTSKEAAGIVNAINAKE